MIVDEERRRKGPGVPFCTSGKILTRQRSCKHVIFCNNRLGDLGAIDAEQTLSQIDRPTLKYMNKDRLNEPEAPPSMSMNNFRHRNPACDVVGSCHARGVNLKNVEPYQEAHVGALVGCLSTEQTSSLRLGSLFCVFLESAEVFFSRIRIERRRSTIPYESNCQFA